MRKLKNSELGRLNISEFKKADKILVMDAGKIVEVGTHNQLLKKEDGYYRNLYEVQFLAEETI